MSAEAATATPAARHLPVINFYILLAAYCKSTGHGKASTGASLSSRQSSFAHRQFRDEPFSPHCDATRRSPDRRTGDVYTVPVQLVVIRWTGVDPYTWPDRA